MSLTSLDVQKAAHLARLAVTDAEIAGTLKSLNDIFAMVKTMQQVPTDGIAPMANLPYLTQRLREDVATEEGLRDTYLSLAKEAEDGLYLVPQVME